MQPDLFGGFLLLKQWGRIGAHGSDQGYVPPNGKHCRLHLVRVYRMT
jgi:hypothetical protein